MAEASWTLHEGDCVDFLGAYAGQVDLIVTSPPYGSVRAFGGHEFDFRAVADALALALAPGGVLVWVVDDQVVDGGRSGESHREALYLAELGLTWHDTMIHTQPGGPPQGWTNRHRNGFQFMFVFSAGGPPAHVSKLVDRVARSAGSRTYGTPRRQADGSLRRGRQAMSVTPERIPRDNVWEYAGAVDNGSARAVSHPGTFPYALARDHVLTWTEPGDLVLDPMAGSGTTLRAAVDLERRAVGMEIHPPYCDLIRDRMAQGVLPLEQQRDGEEVS